MLPYFRKLERHHRGGALHGDTGPLHVSAGESDSPFNAAFIEAGRQAGYPVTDDFNGAQPKGFGRYDLTISNGRRWTAAEAYLVPALSRPNLTVVTEARTTRIRLAGGRATGVDYVVGRSARTATARGEVLVATGAVQSPQLLQLSGIGNPEKLRAAGVTALHDLPGVGDNLQDDLDVLMNWRSRGLRTVFSEVRGVRQLAVGLRYALTRKGVGRQDFLEAGAFIPAREGLDHPDIQIHAVLALMRDHGKVRATEDGFSMHLGQLRSKAGAASAMEALI